jgi:aerotaxis receptor
MMSGKEIVLDKDAFLVSETDAKGTIRFANEKFCEIAGYSVEELIGKPHNIIRHPDMPRAAFKDLWDTVKSGETWTGFVKNYTKNQDYYWVYATVYQIEACDGSTGYLSCRRKASEEEIVEHDALYKNMRSKE